MKKGKIMGIFLVAILLGAFVVKTVFLKEKETPVERDVDLAFAVLSDIHDNDGKFKRAVDDLYGINSYMDALVLNGDTVDEGIDKQYKEMQEAIRKKSNKLPEVIIKNIGNHEYYNYDSDEDTEEYVENFVEKYLEFSGEEKIYHDTWVKGYHFISLGSDAVNPNNVNYTTAYISEEQIDWFKRTIAENYEVGKPIFVFLHQPINMKFFDLEVQGTDKDDEIKKILLQYPEVILFTSHTHLTPNGELDGKGEPMIINTGAIKSNYVEDNKDERGFSEDTSYSNGIYVEVKDNKVIIQARNFKDKNWIYTIEK